jgi:hypothetical protein
VLDAFLQAGLDSEEASELRNSGFVAIDMQALESEERFLVTRSEPVNVFAPSMRLEQLLPAGEGFDSRFVLVDTHTGGVITPLHLRDTAIFGRDGFREPSFAAGRQVAWARVRFRAVPYVVADGLEEYEALTASIQQQDERIFFRGQTKDYQVPRTPRVRRFLYGDESVHETSLPSAAFRHGFPYVEAEPIIESVLGDIEYRLLGTQSKAHWVEDTFEMVYISNGGIAARSTARTMALAQHYGIPTNGLDVTRSSRFAWWFATHAFDAKTGEYSAHFTPRDMPLHDRPVVYALRSHNAVNLEGLNLIATRPMAQHGAFLHGSWGFHGNVCADDLIAIIVLGRDVGICDEPLERLFPVPEADPVYRELLAMKATLTDEPFRRVLEHVFEVH